MVRIFIGVTDRIDRVLVNGNEHGVPTAFGKLTYVGAIIGEEISAISNYGGIDYQNLLAAYGKNNNRIAPTLRTLCRNF